MKKAMTIKEKIGKQLDKRAEAERRGGLLRETSLLKFAWVPNIRKILGYVAEALFAGAGAKPLDAQVLGESVVRAKLRAMGRELRHLEECAKEVANEPSKADSAGGAPTLDAADRRLCAWVEEQRRQILRLAVRFERRVGPPPKEAGA